MEGESVDVEAVVVYQSRSAGTWEETQDPVLGFAAEANPEACRQAVDFAASQGS